MVADDAAVFLVLLVLLVTLILVGVSAQDDTPIFRPFDYQEETTE